MFENNFIDFLNIDKLGPRDEQWNGSLQGHRDAKSNPLHSWPLGSTGFILPPPLPRPPFWNTFYSGLPWQCSLLESVLWYWLLSLGLFCGPWTPCSQMLVFPELYLGTMTVSLLRPHALPGWSYLLLWPEVSSERHCLHICSPHLPPSELKHWISNFLSFALGHLPGISNVTIWRQVLNLSPSFCTLSACCSQ